MTTVTVASEHAPGWPDGTVSTVNMEGSGWSWLTELTGLNFDRSYLHTKSTKSFTVDSPHHIPVNVYILPFFDC